jgi:hypothetical protein
MNLAILPLLLVFLAWPAPPELSVMKEVPLNQEFTVRVGQMARVEGGLKVSFLSVAEDSRCPEGVNCIWAGNGKIVLKISRRGRTPGKINLNTMLNPKEASYQGYEVKLVKLDPYPKKDVRHKRSDYVATLVVSKK